MSNFFDCDEDVLIDEVIQLIMSGKNPFWINTYLHLGRIEARVDYAGGLIIQEPRDMKESALKSTIEAQDEFINASRHIILRSKVAKSCLAPFFIQK